MNRRSFLESLSLAAAGTLVGPNLVAMAQHVNHAQGFSFVFFTDTHIQPELNAAKGCAMCFDTFHGIPADFALCGGDLVYDAAGVNAARGNALFDLYRQTSAAIPYPVHYTIGNHDILGVLTKSGVVPTDPQYGKKAYQDRYGATYYSFDHKDWHFIVLDSIGIKADRNWFGQVDDAQLAWLKADLEKTGRTTPILVVSHVPLGTGTISSVSHGDWLTRTINLGGLVDTLIVTNAAQVIRALAGYNVRAVMQGHTHVNEDITVRGLRFITSGAVCGNWWMGPRAGSAEGFLTVQLHPDGAVDALYQNYGFHAVA